MTFPILQFKQRSRSPLKSRATIWANGFLLSFTMLMMFVRPSHAQQVQILQAVEPGIGFSQFKQWAIENKLVFESFTKDSMIVRDTGIQQWESVRIQVRFCGGDDYAGKASNITIQQLFNPKIEVVTLQRDYVEFLSGKATPDGKIPGTFSIRRDRSDGSGDGIAVSQEGKAGFWEVGLFKKKIDTGDLAMLQTVRRRDSICQ